MISEANGALLVGMGNLPSSCVRFFFEIFLTDWRGDFSVQVEGESTSSPSDLTLDDFSFEECGPPPVTPEECPVYHIKCPDTGEFILHTCLLALI